MSEEVEEENKDNEVIKSSLFLMPGTIVYEIVGLINKGVADHDRLGELLGLCRVLAEKTIPKEKFEMIVESFDSNKKINKFIKNIKEG